MIIVQTFKSDKILIPSLQNIVVIDDFFCIFFKFKIVIVLYF